MQITHYTWSEGSTIREMEIHKLSSGLLEAFIYATDGADKAQLSTLPEALAQAGCQSVVDDIEGRDVLRVTGFKKPEALEKMLGDAGVTSGKSASNVVQKADKKSFSDIIKKRSVNISGIFAIMGHCSVAAAGILERDYKRVSSAALYATATSTYAIYGAGKGKDEYTQLADDMREQLKLQGVEIPDDALSNPASLAKKGGVIETLFGFVKKHPLQTAMALDLSGNANMLRSGLGEGRNGLGRTLDATMALTAGLAIMLVPEKRKNAAKTKGYIWPGAQDEHFKAPKAPEHKGSLPARAFGWVQEKPMRFAGRLYLCGNASQFLNMYLTRKKHSVALAGLDARGQEIDSRISVEGLTPELAAAQQSYGEDYQNALRSSKSGPATLISACSYLMASFFMQMSSKTASTDYSEQEILDKLCAHSANILAAQPQEARGEAIAKVAHYIEKQPNITIEKAALTQMINDKIEALSQSPWLAKVTQDKAAQSITPAGVTI